MARKVIDKFEPPLNMNDYLCRVSCRTKREVYLDKLQKIFSDYPHIGVPREPSKIIEGVFVGATADAEKFDLLHRFGITHVVFCSKRRRPLYSRSNSKEEAFSKGIVGYLHIEEDNLDDFDISVHFRYCLRWIWEARKVGGQVLICGEGPSMCGAICMAYLMERGAYLLQAAKMLKDQRRTGVCDLRYQKQLVEYAAEQNLLDPNPDKVKTTRYGTGRDRFRLITAHLPEVVIVHRKF